MITMQEARARCLMAFGLFYSEYKPNEILDSTAIGKIVDKIFSESFSKQIIDTSKEENNLDDPHFKGDTYEKEIDQKALKGDFFKVFGFMADHEGQYFTDPEIAEATGVYIPSVQRMRCYMKQKEWGSHVMIRRRRAGQRLYEFACFPNKESLTYHFYKKNIPVF